MAHRSLALIVCSLLLSACGGDPYEKAAKQSVNVMEDMVEILEGVTDKASAEAARGKLEKLVSKTKEMKADLMKLGAPTPEQQKKLMEMAQSLQAETQALSRRMVEALTKINSIPEAKAILDPTTRGLR